MIASFACGLRSDCAAVAAALREPWSNGQTEGQINRLKTRKRQIYGRANIDRSGQGSSCKHEPGNAPTLS